MHGEISIVGLLKGAPSLFIVCTEDSCANLSTKQMNGSLDANRLETLLVNCTSIAAKFLYLLETSSKGMLKCYGSA